METSIDAYFCSAPRNSSLPQASTPDSYSQSDLDKRTRSRTKVIPEQSFDGMPQISTPAPTKTYQGLGGRRRRPFYQLPTYPSPRPPRALAGHEVTRTTAANHRSLRTKTPRGSVVCFLFSKNYISAVWSIEWSHDYLFKAMRAGILAHKEEGEVPDAASIIVPVGAGWDASGAIGANLEALNDYLPRFRWQIGKYGPVKSIGGGGFWLFKASQGTLEIQDIYIPEEAVETAHAMAEELLQSSTTARTMNIPEPLRLVMGSVGDPPFPSGTEIPSLGRRQLDSKSGGYSSGVVRRASSGISQSQDKLTLAAKGGSAALFLYGRNWITGGHQDASGDMSIWMRMMIQAAEQKEPIRRFSYMIPRNWIGGVPFSEELRAAMGRLWSTDYSGQKYDWLVSESRTVTFSTSIDQSFVNFFAGDPGAAAPTGTSVVSIPDNIQQRYETLMLSTKPGSTAVFLYSGLGLITAQASPLDLRALGQVARSSGEIVAWSMISPDPACSSEWSQWDASQVSLILEGLYGEGVDTRQFSYSCPIDVGEVMWFKTSIDNIQIEHGFIQNLLANETLGDS